MKRPVVAVVATMLAAAAPPASAQPRRVTLPEAIALATDGNVAVAVDREQVVAAEARVRSAKAQRLPTLGVRANVFLWDSPIKFAVGEPVPPATEPPTITAREQITSSVEVTALQPISGSLVINKLVQLEQHGAAARRAELEQTRLELAYRAAEAYLTTLEAATLREIAQQSVTQIDANLVRARALRTGGILFDVDVLRLEAQRDALRVRALEAEAGFTIARRGLALILGLPDGTELDLAPVDTAPPALPGTEDEAVAAALSKRPELRVADAGLAQARLGVEVQRANYFPSINAVATYSHSEGGGAFATKDSGFFGLTLDWQLWDWGRRKAQVAEARSTVRQAELGRGALLDALALDARSKWTTASIRRQTVDVADSGLRAAEEAHRLQNVRFEAGAATTTDVIDAETAVALARAQATTARHQYLIAWMALIRATGETRTP